MDQYKKANRALWDEWTKINASSKLYRMDEFQKGINKLNPLEVEEVGDVRGRSLLHLQCHFGMDSLSWAKLGARVTGVDFSPQAIELARDLSARQQIPAEFICCDIYDLPDYLAGEFDVVFTSYGVLTWLPDINRWAEIVAQYIKPGGFFYIAEFHPFAMTLDDNSTDQQWRIGYDYFDKDVMIFDVKGSYADPTAETSQPFSYEWQHTMGDIITALIRAGLRIQFLHEYDHCVYEMFPFLIEGPDGYWHIPEGMKKMPLIFSIKAIKD